MYASLLFPAGTHPSQQHRVADNSVSERVDAFRRSNGRTERNIITPKPDSVTSSTRPFPWVQDEAPDITISMRNEKFKWWNAPPKSDEKSKTDITRIGEFELHVPSVEALQIDALFLSPSCDDLRSFRNDLCPGAQTEAQNYAMKLRDQKFKEYNGRAVRPNISHTSQYLDHNTQGAMPGAPQPHQVSIDEEESYLLFLEDLQNWIGNWIGYLVLILAFLFFDTGSLIKILKPVLSFLSRGGVASSLLFFWVLFLLIK